MVTEAADQERCGFVAIIGAPNVGKSTLLNRFVGAKVSIVTHKVQTTRTRIRGITTCGKAQIIFVDTPGIFVPRRRLDRAMVDAAWRGVGDADVTVLMVDAPLYWQSLDDKPSRRAWASRSDTDRILRELKKHNRRVILALNKIDDMPRGALLQVTNALRDETLFLDTFMISAARGEGVDDLLHRLAGLMPAGPWLYPEDQLADLPQRLLAAELTREKLMLRLHQELPYVTTVETESWREREDGSIRIEQVIYVARDSHKAIVLGKGGATIKDIGRWAREEMEQVFGRRIHLFLFVKVREKWLDDPERYREMGLDFPKA